MSDEHELCQQLAQPGAEHGRLEPFAGEFKAQVKLWMGPGDPVVSTGVMRNSLDLGGRFLRQTYRGDPGAGPFPDFQGQGFWGFNNVTKRYEGFWVDTASTVMQTETGEVDESGKVWTMKGKMPDPQGNEMGKRSVITLVDENHHKLEMYFEQGGQEFKAMEIEYSRAK